MSLYYKLWFSNPYIFAEILNFDITSLQIFSDKKIWAQAQFLF